MSSTNTRSAVITLITATHELLQIGFLAWWSQYALRFLGRYQDANDAPRFYRTENAVLLASIALQSAAVIGILLLVIAPGARPGLLFAAVAYVITRSLNVYIGERAPRSSSSGFTRSSRYSGRRWILSPAWC